MTFEDVINKYAGTPNFEGINVTDPNQKGIFGDAAIHMAAGSGEIDDLEVLIGAGANIDLPGEMGNTALHEAASRGHSAFVNRLIELGANKNVINSNGNTPIDLAKIGGHELVVDILSKKYI